MIRPRHVPESLTGVDHNGLRRLKALPRTELPSKVEGVQTDTYPCRTERIYFRTSFKAPAVHEAKAVCLSIVFRCLWSDQCRKRVELMAAHASFAIDPGFALMNRLADNVRFPSPCSRQVHYLQITLAREIDTGA
ncbi:hypothetical protein D3C72_1107450 [compost metagenome]